jgi:hypothetical protein
MSHCLKNCYLYMEYHSTDDLSSDIQLDIEREISKFKAGMPYDEALVSKILKRRCLGSYLKDPNRLPNKCRHYWELISPLTEKERLDILSARRDRTWKIISGIVAIVGILLSSYFAYLNYSKPSNEDLAKENNNLRIFVRDYEKTIAEQNKRINELNLRLQQKHGVEND